VNYEVQYKYYFLMEDLMSIYNEEKIEPIEISQYSTTTQLLNAMSKTGFQGRKLAEAKTLFEKMILDDKTVIIFGYSAALAVAGQNEIINWLINNNYIDLLVSTGANISEDLIFGLGNFYYKYSHYANDGELFIEGYNRYYDIIGKESDYTKMTEFISEFILSLDEDYNYSSREFLNQFGKWLFERNISSLVTTAFQNNVPIFCPAIVDSPYGDAALIAKSKNFSIHIDSIKDYIEFMGFANQVKDTGVIYIGGGVPKDFIQLFAVTPVFLYNDRLLPDRKKPQFRKQVNDSYYPHKYALQITTDSPQWGGLSGCTFEEAISWGKEKRNGNFVQCFCDATIALPIICQSIKESNLVRKNKCKILFKGV